MIRASARVCGACVQNLRPNVTSRNFLKVNEKTRAGDVSYNATASTGNALATLSYNITGKIGAFLLTLSVRFTVSCSHLPSPHSEQQPGNVYCGSGRRDRPILVAVSVRECRGCHLVVRHLGVVGLPRFPSAGCLPKRHGATHRCGSRPGTRVAQFASSCSFFSCPLHFPFSHALQAPISGPCF